MTNAWKVMWEYQEGRKKKKFEGDSPKEAVDFGKDLKKKGLVVLGVISMRKAYAPKIGSDDADRVGHMWCPYCVKYRPFEFLSRWIGKVLLPPELRCPVCGVSINDYWVRHFNPLIAARFLHLTGVKDAD